MNINELTIGEAKELAQLFSAGNVADSNAHWQIGENYLIRTVTHINIGTLIAVTSKELVMRDVAWIADTGRFEQCVKDGQLSEVEPFPDGEIVIIGRGALIDAVRWQNELPRVQK